MKIQQEDGENIIATALRVLTFRATREELLALNGRHLAFGLLCTWLVGMGRYWHNPRAHTLQMSGVGSVVYVFVLALILWIIIYPLRPRDWSYRGVLIFVTLTSPPAVLYAIRVERFYDLHTAQTWKVWFLAVVATCRVALLVFYLARLGQLSVSARVVATLLPLTLIVTTLTALNLDRVVFDIKGGLNETGTADDGAYMVLVFLTVLAVFAFIPLLGWYGFLIWKAHKSRDNQIDPAKPIYSR